MKRGRSQIARRGFVLGCALFLMGCAQSQMTQHIAGGLDIRSVTVRTDVSKQAVAGRPNAITHAQLTDAVTRVVKPRLAARAGQVPGDLVIEIKEVNLVSRGASALAPVQSTARLVLSVTEPGTGQALLDPTEVIAYSAQFRAGGLIGAATAPGVQKDYEGMLTGIANTVEKRLYGEAK